MRAIIQRVQKSQVSISEDVVAAIDQGLLILLGISPTDNEALAQKMAGKIATLRIFEDDEGKMNLSLLDVGGEALIVSQFTLYADTRRGRRPSFTQAAKPEFAEPLVNVFVEMMQQQGVRTQAGVFGAHMQVALVNDGPVTILLDYNLNDL
jgi:D-tyrosyl-tRNA(Tyr) deacylase